MVHQSSPFMDPSPFLGGFIEAQATDDHWSPSFFPGSNSTWSVGEKCLEGTPFRELNSHTPFQVMFESMFLPFSDMLVSWRVIYVKFGIHGPSYLQKKTVDGCLTLMSDSCNHIILWYIMSFSVDIHLWGVITPVTHFWPILHVITIYPPGTFESMFLLPRWEKLDMLVPWRVLYFQFRIRFIWPSVIFSTQTREIRGLFHGYFRSPTSPNTCWILLR